MDAEEALDLTEDRVWVFKESEVYDGYQAPVQKAKGLVNRRDDVEFEDLLAKKLGARWGKSRIVVVEVD